MHLEALLQLLVLVIAGAARHVCLAALTSPRPPLCQLSPALPTASRWALKNATDNVRWAKQNI
jgi:hypothetical protein